MASATDYVRLQSVQNAAARLVTGARRSDHITPVLWQLHSLPVRQRVAFKIAGLVHQSLAGAAPAYLQSMNQSIYFVTHNRYAQLTKPK